MATEYYGVTKGAGLPSDVTVATSTTSSAMELAVDLAVFTTKIDAIKALEAIELRIAQGAWPPA